MVMNLKKRFWGDELLTLALLLSLLRPEGLDIPTGVLPVTSSGFLLALHSVRRNSFGTDILTSTNSGRVKNLLLETEIYQRDIINELITLGRFDHRNNWIIDRTENRQEYGFPAYLLTLDNNVKNAEESTNAVTPSQASVNSPNLPSPTEDDELSPEDMALIEVLWKQDVDIGVPLDVFTNTATSPTTATTNNVDDNPDLTAKNKTADTGQETVVKSPDKGVENQTKADPLFANNDSTTDDEEDDGPLTSVDPWAGGPYTIDLETGEFVLREEDDSLGEVASAVDPLAAVDQDIPTFENFSLEEALKIVGLDDKEPEETKSDNNNSTADPLLESVKSEEEEADQDIEAALNEMMQTHQQHIYHHHRPTPHHHHHHVHQGRVPLVRAMSMEQRWQDLAQLLTPPTSMPAPPVPHHHHHHHHLQHQQDADTAHHFLPPQPPTFSSYSAGGVDPRNVLLHNATLAPPMGDLNSTAAYTGLSSIGGTSSHLGNAVATSMNLTNSSEPMGPTEQTQQPYKLESDMLYYQNGTNNSTTSEPLNQTTDGFLTSILNDEDLQLMDMAMNEGMYTMRLLEGSNNSGANNATTATAAPHPPVILPQGDNDGSSDSAVSSMGSERGGAWVMEPHNSSSPATDPTYLDYGAHQGGKFRPYDYSGAYSRQGPAQKKHHMFGKRFFQEQSNSTGVPAQPPTPNATKLEMKYSCSLEFVRHHGTAEARSEHIAHNHTYHLPNMPETSGVNHRPLTRDKHHKQGRRGGGSIPSNNIQIDEDPHLTRDEKRARSMNIPITVDDIINLPMDEFNERLSKYDLTEAQLSLIRDIRRRGKNKVAAQNCRKRKLDQILSLADEVRLMRDRKIRLLRDKEEMTMRRQRLKEKFAQLYRHVFQALRDPEGRPYSSYEYSLQQSADGSVLLVPRGTSTDDPQKQRRGN